MRQQIDCAVMMFAAHETWMPEVLKEAEAVLSRIRVHRLDWEAGHHLETEPGASVNLPIETIALAGVGLRRYDIALLPISMETLAWTRQALGAIPRGPFIPIMGVLKEMRSAAIQDLLELGMCDFVRWPICPEELRARLLTSVTTVPRPGSLREPEPGYGQASWLNTSPVPSGTNPSVLMRPSPPLRFPRTKGVRSGSRRLTSVDRKSRSTKVRSDVINKHLAKLTPATRPISFKAAKAALVESFERQFIHQALEMSAGNIAMAARYANKHRRAFWALMRKYEIGAFDYLLEGSER